MKFQVEEVKTMKPNFISSNCPLSIIFDVFMSERQAEELFYTLWETYEGGAFEKWIEREGYKLVKEQK